MVRGGLDGRDDVGTRKRGGCLRGFGVGPAPLSWCSPYGVKGQYNLPFVLRCLPGWFSWTSGHGVSPSAETRRTCLFHQGETSNAVPSNPASYRVAEAAQSTITPSMAIKVS